jgi:Asp/Glu/hydantoin racemase
MLIINPNTVKDTVEKMGAESRKIVSPDPTLATPKLMESLIDLGYPQSRVNRQKPPLDSPADASGAIAYDRGWLDEA